MLGSPLRIAALALVLFLVTSILFGPRTYKEPPVKKQVPSTEAYGPHTPDCPGEPDPNPPRPSRERPRPSIIETVRVEPEDDERAMQRPPEQKLALQLPQIRKPCTCSIPPRERTQQDRRLFVRFRER